LVQGPYLVRNARVNHKTEELEITGDLDEQQMAKGTQIHIFAASKLLQGRVLWNGKEVQKGPRDGSVLRAFLPPDRASTKFKLPDLGPWKHHDSLPEIDVDYTTSDKTWIGQSVLCLQPLAVVWATPRTPCSRQSPRAS